MLGVSDLACGRRGQLLVQGIEFEVVPGGVLQLEGTNGSGKTTLLRTLAGLAPPLFGQVVWNGEDIRRCKDVFRQALVYIGHDDALEPELTAIENLRIMVTLGGETVPESQLFSALESFGLEALWERPTRQLSQGQRRRIALARLWCTRKPLWLLDEPLAALDRQAMACLEARVTAHLHSGGLLVYATHQPMLRALHPRRLVMMAA